MFYEIDLRRIHSIVVRSGVKANPFATPPVFDVTAGTHVPQVTGNRLEMAGGHNGSFKTMIPGSVSRRTIVPDVKKDNRTKEQ